MKLFVFFITYALGQYIVLIVSFVPDYIHSYYHVAVPSTPIHMVTAGLEIALLLFIYKSILTPMKYILKTFHKENFIMSILPLSTCLILFVIYCKEVFDLYTLALVISITFIFIVAFYSLNLAIQLKDRKNNLENQLSLQINHYRGLTQSIQKNRIYRHDMRHHLLGIAQLLEKRDLAATQVYLDSLQAQYAKSQTLGFCENKYVDAVLSHYFKIARQKSIKVTARLYALEELGIEPLDLCVIIGGCYENAIAACHAVKKTEERWISIYGKITCNGVTITSKNSYSSENSDPKGQSCSLNQQDWQGRGVENVCLLAQKYDGNIKTCAMRDIFITEISLKAPQSLSKGLAKGAMKI